MTRTPNQNHPIRIIVGRYELQFQETSQDLFWELAKTIQINEPNI